MSEIEMRQQLATAGFEVWPSKMQKGYGFSLWFSGILNLNGFKLSGDFQIKGGNVTWVKWEKHWLVL